MTLSPIASRPRRAPLTETTLATHAERVRVPGYDRSSLVATIVHLGVGNFHRAHQAIYLDELAERGITRECGVIGVALRRRAMKDDLDAQDGLFTVVERDEDADSARVVGSLTEMLFAPRGRDTVVDALARPETRIVTLTVTDAGYRTDTEYSPVALELLVDALDLRRRAGMAPFTVLSCDNVPANGATTRAAVVSLAARRDPTLASWIDREGAFPGTMVDRITAATTDATRSFVARTFGIVDRRPVVTEPFSQWVIEDTFCNGRPPLEEVGVEFVDDVVPYARMKKGLLNGGQAALGYLAYLLGYRDTARAMADGLVRRYVELLMRDEIAPLVPAINGVDADRYRETLLQRLSNPMLDDSLARLCRRGSAKVPGHLLPTIRDARRAGRPHELLTLAVAAWLRYLRGVDLEGRSITVIDPRVDELQPLAIRHGDDPARLITESAVFGSLADDPMLVRSLGRALEAFDRDGLRATVAAYVNAGDIPA
jgi:fructuronate reductase/mannitol 2-dehydrogenase